MDSRALQWPPGGSLGRQTDGGGLLLVDHCMSLFLRGRTGAGVDTALPFLVPSASAAAMSGGKSLSAGLGNSFHSQCLCFLLAVGSEARPLSEFHHLSNRDVHDDPHFSWGGRFLTQRTYALEAVSTHV